MKKVGLLLLSVIIISMAVNFSAKKKYEKKWEAIDNRPIPQWFSDSKFGIFIHWGIYSVPAWGPLPADGADVYGCYAEWYWARLINKTDPVHQLFIDFHEKNYGADFPYTEFVHQFTAEKFSPNDWAKLLYDSGAKYVVLTSKHHEGFTLWPSEHSPNWNSVDVGPHRDLVGELTSAVKAIGLRMGLYYSLYEWESPLYKDIDKYVDNHMIPQMKDLVNRYHPEVLWTDGEWDHHSDKWKSADFLTWLYNESPVKETIVVNDRWGKDTRGKHGGFYTSEYDSGTEEEVKDSQNIRIWEECRGIGNSFGYNRNEKPEDYLTTKELIHLLIEKVATGGNLLLNIGPTAEGLIPKIMQQRLIEMGEWLKVNGEAIYGTSTWEIANKQADISAYFTTKGNDLYVILTQFPTEQITIKGISGNLSVTLLGSEVEIQSTQNEKDLTINPPAFAEESIPCNHAWVLKVSREK